ncbi:TPA: hypothetical protein JI052_04730 [Acinetobacter baumannii]|nr:hypothetical protein J521_1071 [Acinetobacter baumannii 1035119]HAV5441401.1 hypothetical protein [Acinetobacter baumannii]
MHNVAWKNWILKINITNGQRFFQSAQMFTHFILNKIKDFGKLIKIKNEILKLIKYLPIKFPPLEVILV